MEELSIRIIKCLQDKHDAFIGSQATPITQAENKGFKQGLQWAIGTVETLTELIKCEQSNNEKICYDE